MERGLIRRRWQVTIPRGIRRRLNLSLGQVLSWEIIEEDTGTEIRVITGHTCKRLEDMAAFQEPLARRKRKEKARKKKQVSAGFIRISDAKTRSILGEMVRDVTRAILSGEAGKLITKGQRFEDFLSGDAPGTGPPTDGS